MLSSHSVVWPMATGGCSSRRIKARASRRLPSYKGEMPEWLDKGLLDYTKAVRLKRYGRKRLAIVHEKEDLTDTPRYYLTDALHWEGVKRHFPLSCVAQSLIQRAPVVESKCERFQFAKGEATIGQRCRTIAREILHSILELSKRLFTEGKSTEAVVDMLMPA